MRTRIWMGAVLIALATAMLVFDQRYRPWYPFLLLFFVVLSLVGCRELVTLLPGEQRPHAGLCLVAVLAVLLANWPAHCWGRGDPWRLVLGVFAAAVLAAFLLEMATFREPGHSVMRMALATWTVAYLGVLPSFLAQLRWLPAEDGEAGQRGVGALALAIFVPKFCDIGAYFTGRLLGRHRMTPVLSPKKTWEGLAGGLVLSAVTSVAINRLPSVPPLRAGDWAAVGFGLTVGLAGVLGDLAESLIKRDCRAKDASQVVPGFGGVLDVVDSVIFAAPVAYVWLAAY